MFFSWILENLTIIEEAGDAVADVCDFSSCNGFLLETEKFQGKTYTAGQCQFSINEDESFCFVNEDSMCDKFPTEFDGIFTSSVPCEDERAPKPRFFPQIFNQITNNIQVNVKICSWFSSCR